MMAHFNRLLDHKRRFALLSAVAAVIILLTMSCSFPNLRMSSGRKSNSAGGTLLVSISGTTTRSLLPPIDMNIASYQITGTGPNGKTFARDTTQTSEEITGLGVGTWNVVVAAINKDGDNIGMGSDAITLGAGEAASLSVTVAPIDGIGTLNLSTTWPAAEVANPSIQASLLPPAGLPIPLNYTIGSGTATVTRDSIPSGYYTLTQTLLDGNTVVMGAVEVVRIVTGQTTSGTFDFSNLNAADPSLTVDVTPVMNDPLNVAVTGVSATLSAGSSITVTPTVSGYSGNVTFVYYVNGTAKGSSTTSSPAWTFGSDLPVGNYRLDITAYTADGLRAGSSSASFSVTAPTTASITLAWDADASTVAGYKLHYGQAAGSYTSVVDAGATTTATVSGLVRGKTYYFAATAYNSTGVESSYSNEVTYTVPAS